MFFFALKCISITKEVILVEKREQFKMIVTYDNQGNSIEDIFCNILKQMLLSVEKSGFDSPPGEVVECEARDK